ncbi:MAG: redox-sensing transcriptional repressor Rex [Paludibacteraceae bacterium]|nr:redox-sensing transcriptional repressor Rex [Paludibacteraceae bacterium]
MSDHAIHRERVPEPALRRLPWYLAYAKLSQRNGEQSLSSTQIARALDIDASQVAKDLSAVNVSGKTRVGYEVSALVNVLERFLGFGAEHNAIVCGVGNLGASLIQDNGLRNYGLNIIAGFDVKYEMDGMRINQIPIHHMDRFAELCRKTGTEIGILTVPVESAQSTAEQMIAGGIRAIWNFTPFRIRVPEDIIVQNTSIYSHLALIFNRLAEVERRK